MQYPLPVDDLDFVLLNTAQFWSRFQDSRMLITGGTGFIGSWLTQTIQYANDKLNSKIDLIVLSRNPQRAINIHPKMLSRRDTHLVCGDIRTFTLPKGPIDLCIHAATDAARSGNHDCPLVTFDSIVNGTRHVLDVANSRGVSRFLMTSSGAIYGTQPPDLTHIPENFTGAPNCLNVNSAYGNAKRAAEWLAITYAANHEFAMDAIIARIFSLIGPGIPLSGPFAAGNFIRNILDGKPIVIEGDGSTVRSYLYMADLCVWLLRLLESGHSGEAYNVGSENPLSILDLAKKFASGKGKNYPIEIRNPSCILSLPPRYVPDTSKARQYLRLKQNIPIDEALHKTLLWSNPS